MNKGQIYHAARRAGKNDAEANALAGFSGRTPERVRQEWTAYELISQIRNSWGEGPREIQRIIDESQRELDRIEARMEKDRARADELRRNLKMARLGSVTQNEGAATSSSDIFFDRMSAGREEG